MYQYRIAWLYKNTERFHIGIVWRQYGSIESSSWWGSCKMQQISIEILAHCWTCQQAIECIWRLSIKFTEDSISYKLSTHVIGIRYMKLRLKFCHQIKRNCLILVYFIYAVTTESAQFGAQNICYSFAQTTRQQVSDYSHVSVWNFGANIVISIVSQYWIFIVRCYVVIIPFRLCYRRQLIPLLVILCTECGPNTKR